jgi:hypothetical protein
VRERNLGNGGGERVGATVGEEVWLETDEGQGVDDSTSVSSDRNVEGEVAVEGEKGEMLKRTMPGNMVGPWGMAMRRQRRSLAGMFQSP